VYAIKLILTVLLLVVVSGCSPERPTKSRPLQPDYSRESYCRSIGLYKEVDSNDCETFSDAYDLDEGSKDYVEKKRWYDDKYPLYRKYNSIKYVPGTVIRNQANVIALQKAESNRRKMETSMANALKDPKKAELRRKESSDKRRNSSKPLNFNKSTGKPVPKK
jgi:hypothetical protein